MEKLTLERFREIKQEINKLVEQVNQIEIQYGKNEEEIRKLGLSKEEEKKRIHENYEKEVEEIDLLGEKANVFIEELQNSDLSEIPFEEYEGFVIAREIDYSETKANLDFSIIDFKEGRICKSKRL